MKPVKRSILFGITCALLSCSAVPLTVSGQPVVSLLDDSGNAVSSYNAVTEDTSWAQEFTMPDNGISYQMAGLTLCNETSVFNSGTPIASLSLWSAANNAPGSELGMIGAQVIDGNGNYTFNPSADLQLSSSTSYFIEFNAANGVWYLSGTSPDGATGLGTFGDLYEQEDGGWTPADEAVTMILTGGPVPEPSASALFGFGIFGVAAALRRRNCRPA